MGKYLYNGDEIHEFLKELKKIDEYMKSSYNMASELKQKIETGDWNGKSKDAMVAFMDLVTQLHNQYQCTNNPIESFILEFDKFQDVLDDFALNFPEYLALSKI